MKEIYKPRYSGPERSGICICGCSWDRHHLGLVARQEYIDQTNEGYIPQECENFGFNECGGMKLEGDIWVNHCSRYQDSLGATSI